MNYSTLLKWIIQQIICWIIQPYKINENESWNWRIHWIKNTVLSREKLLVLSRAEIQTIPKIRASNLDQRYSSYGPETYLVCAQWSLTESDPVDVSMRLTIFLNRRTEKHWPQRLGKQPLHRELEICYSYLGKSTWELRLKASTLGQGAAYRDRNKFSMCSRQSRTWIGSSSRWIKETDHPLNRQQ